MSVYKPQWAKDGCKVVREWSKEFTSGKSEGIAYWVEYKDPKGKTRTCVKWVKWKS